MYINTDGRVGARLDHYFKTLRAAGEIPPPSDKPAFYRAEENETAWNVALDTLDVKNLYVQSMGRDERRRIAHDKQGFPVERRWAKENTDKFRLVFQTKAVEIYRINR